MKRNLGDVITPALGWFIGVLSLAMLFSPILPNWLVLFLALIAYGGYVFLIFRDYYK